jgi:hypothetical protein
MVGVLASSAVDLGRVEPKTIKLVFVASPLSTQPLQAISQAHIVNNDGVVVRLRLCCKGGMEVNLTNNQTITKTIKLVFVASPLSTQH